ncbi:Hsp20/alpha crystallin family protein [Leeia oryzae]|uniref:Hsp20/alpha crystallin family protein n=1 Tax=Leeia oryzae TaxID=356662 RepID=UPI00036F8ACF|nr:Hsp20/alpha crystallin family protein [Leeia oryzae]
MSTFPARQSLFDDLFRDFSSGFSIKPLHGDALPASITVDIKEAADSYTVLAELPGVARDDIHATIDGSTVTIKAEVKQHDSENKDEKILRSERYYGAVSRSFQLPVDIDESKAQAKFENGVLKLTLPKRTANATNTKLRID